MREDREHDICVMFIRQAPVAAMQCRTDDMRKTPKHKESVSGFLCEKISRIDRHTSAG